MPLSPDPEKRARSLANLRKGPATAAKNFGLPVVDYGEEPEPNPPAKVPKQSSAGKLPQPPAGPPARTATGSSAGPPTLLVVGAGLAALVVLIMILNRTPGAHA